MPDNVPNWLQNLSAPQEQTENSQKFQTEEAVPDWLAIWNQ